MPLLTLAVPGSAAAAVLLGAMLIHGLRPGPMLMIENPMLTYRVIVMTLLATVAMFVLGLSMVRTLVKVLMVPRTKLMAIVFVLCVVGAFALSSRRYDISIMVAFGLVGFVLREMQYPMAPLVLGIILGKILDENLRRALILSGGSITPFITRPISLVLIAAILFVIITRLPFVASFIEKTKAKRQKKG
jgi:putative tricarboxylic transport membrane protein